MAQQSRSAGPAPKISNVNTSLRSKTLRVALRLEALLGTPRQSRPLPDPLEMLIATILSQNTNDKNSHRAYTELRRRFPSWSALADAPVKEIRNAIRSGGMANQKSLRIKETLAAVRERYGAFSLSSLKRKSNDRVLDELTQLKGVGFKTASCVLLFSMGRDVFPVDTHVHRICGRLGLATNCKSPEETFHFMRSRIPKGKGYSFHTNLIRFGRTVCRSTNPHCGECVLFAMCVYEEKRALAGRRTTNTSNADHDFMLLDNVRKQKQ